MGKKRWENPWTEIEHLQDNHFEMVVGGRQVFRDVDGKWKKLAKKIFPNAIALQSAQCAILLFLKYGSYYTPDLKDKRLEKEIFYVEQLKNNKWETILDPELCVSGSNLIETPDLLEFTVNHENAQGILTIKYILLASKPLKHDITFQSKINATETFRLKQVWLGIKADTYISKGKKSTSTTQKDKDEYKKL